MRAHLATALVGSILAAGPAWAVPYSFELIATAPTGGNINSFTITNAGAICWSQIDGGSNTAIFRRVGNTTQTIATGQLSGTQVGGSSMNSLNVIGYRYGSNSQRGLIRTDGVTSTTLIDQSGVFADFGPAGIDDGGTITAWAQRDDGKTGIYAFSIGSFATIAESGTGLTGFDTNVAVNHSGQTLFKAEATFPDRRLYIGNAGGLTLIDETNAFSSNFAGRAVNDAGHVLYIRNSATARQLVRWNGSSTTVLADDSATFLSFDNVSIAANDSMAFLATLANGRRGIFTGTNPGTDTVLRENDSLFGATVNRLVGPAHGGLNDSGQILFVAGLSSGSEVLVRATPLPEPAFTIVPTLFCAAMLKRRRRPVRRACCRSTRGAECSRKQRSAPMRFIVCALLAPTAVLALPCSPCDARATGVTITDLGSLPSKPNAAGYGINASGQVAGQSNNANFDDHAFRYTGGSLLDLGVLPGRRYSDGLAINDLGQIAGYSGGSSTGVGGNHAFLYNNSTMTDLGALPGQNACEAYGINNAGKVVGYSYTDTISDFRAFIYDGSLHDLGLLPGGTTALAFGINGAGDVVGECSVPGQGSRSFVYHSGTMTDIGGVPGSNVNGAKAINDQGHIVGYSGVAGVGHPYLYDGSTFRDLGILPGTVDGVAEDINSVDQVVGRCNLFNGSGSRAFLYSGGVLMDLNSLLPPGSGWTLQDARGINDAGQIVGFGTFGGHTRAFVMTVPEPTSMLPPLLLASLLWRRQRRRGYSGTSLRSLGISVNTPLVRAAACIVVPFAWAAMLTTAAVSATPSYPYSVTDLGALSGGTTSYATSINNAGQVIGYGQTSANVLHALLYNGAGAPTDLNNLIQPPPWLGWVQYANGMNSHGQVAAYGYLTNGQARAMFYQNGTITDLGTFGGAWSWASAINESGQLVGYAAVSELSFRAFVYSGGVKTMLGTLGGLSSGAYDISESGKIAGWAFLSGNTVSHACLFTDGNVVDLGSLGGDSVARSVNESGQAVGSSATAAGNDSYGFLYSDGQMINLGTFGDPRGFTSAESINNVGDVVGISRTASGADHAFLYNGGVLKDLNNMIDPASGWVLAAAGDINDSGQIVGWGYNPLGQVRAFLLTPVPEPASALISLGAVSGLFVNRFCRRWRRAGGAKGMAGNTRGATRKLEGPTL